MAEPDTLKLHKRFMHWLFITFLVCWPGISMAGQGEKATIPKQLQELLASSDYKVIKCKPLEEGKFCHSSSIVHSIQIFDREDRKIKEMDIIMSRLSTQPTVASRFDGIDPQSWDSPHTQAAAVSNFLATSLNTALELPTLYTMVTGLESISEQGHHSIILTAINTLRAIRQSAEPVNLPPTMDELVNDVRLDLNQFGSLEVAMLLSITLSQPTLVLDGSNHSGVIAITITVPGGAHTMLPWVELRITQQEELSQGRMERELNNASFRFVVSPEYGLLPLERLNESLQEPPVPAASTQRLFSCSSNECPATCYDTQTGGFRNAGTSDDKPVKSRISPTLKKGLPKESIRDKWERYSNRFRQQTPDKPDSITSNPSLITYRNLAVVFIGSAIGTFLGQDERVRACLYQSVCGNRTWHECQKYYVNNYFPR
ncbi:hypothetical protein [Endozoicomonas euniceicola]|uniref:Uncharacterized protein n=1 Tax=Endozoicomonas euniceicola TaxID=1234143 RepID=A0ABY6GN06_9GAMM|nr:hypothetical protein [Endozoicomonas euniceicola]UYM14107.1 hypothetical protein NX720_14445 [Endozoicomonas euniceicola]